MTAEAPLRMLSFRPGTSKVVFKKVRSMMISCNPVGKLECVKHHPRSLDSICFRFTAKYINYLTENYLPSGMKLYHLRVSLVMLSWVKNSKLCYRDHEMGGENLVLYCQSRYICKSYCTFKTECFLFAKNSP